MKEHWFKFDNREICLTEYDMCKVHEYYVVQRNADYLRNNYPHLEEEKVMEMAWEWRDKEMKDGYSNEEALAELLEEYGVEEETDDDDDFDDSEAWEDGSSLGCSDAPESECNGHCMSCAYRPI